MNQRRFALGLLLLFILCLGLLAWHTFAGSSVSKNSDEILSLENRPRIVRPDRPPLEPLPPISNEGRPVPMDGLTEEAIFRDAMNLAWPGKMTVSCPATGLQPGLLRPQPASDAAGGTASFAVVENTVLLMVVEGREGTAILNEFLSPAARVSWSIPEDEVEGSCRVGPLRTQTIRGRVVDYDGTPAAGVDIRGCIHGDLLSTSEQGEFSMEALEGTTCFPMAFMDRDGVFARSDSPGVDVGSEPPPEVLLTLEEGWSAEQQLVLMGQMAQVMERMANKITEANPAAHAAGRAEHPEVAEQLMAWGLAEQAQHDMIWDDLERLTLDEDPYVAFRDIWMNQY